MKKNRLKIIIEKDTCISPEELALLKSCAFSAADKEELPYSCYVCLSLCSNSEIRTLNHKERGIDSATDVLSFPSVVYEEGLSIKTSAESLKSCYDIDEMACFLGEIVISYEKTKEQAKTFGHSFERELAYLFVHGLCHLFGYDHIKEKEKEKMRTLEESILSQVGLQRIDRDILIANAFKALQNAHSPYSKFRVGACLLTKDGTLFTGCNVENASYGLTNCAERTAIFKAVSEGYRDFAAIAIVAEKSAPWPCGACRQVLSEFCADIPIFLAWADEGKCETSLAELLPHSFSPSGGIQDFIGKE